MVDKAISYLRSVVELAVSWSHLLDVVCLEKGIILCPAQLVDTSLDLINVKDRSVSKL